MKLRVVGFVIALSSVLLLSGCSKINSIFGTKSADYSKSGSIAALDVPPDLTAPEYDSTFDINKKNVHAKATITSAPSSIASLERPLQKPDANKAIKPDSIVRSNSSNAGLKLPVKARTTKPVAPAGIKRAIDPLANKNNKARLAKNTKKVKPVKKRKPVKLKPRKTLLSKTPDGQPVLLVQADYNTTWVQTAVLLKRAGFAIDGQNKKQGLIAAKYTGGKGVAKKGSKHIIHIIKTAQGGAAMRVLDEKGQPLKANKAKKILAKLKKEFTK